MASDPTTQYDVIMWTVVRFETLGPLWPEKFVQALCSDSKHSRCSSYLGCQKWDKSKFKNCMPYRINFRHSPEHE